MRAHTIQIEFDQRVVLGQHRSDRFGALDVTLNICCSEVSQIPKTENVLTLQPECLDRLVLFHRSHDRFHAVAAKLITFDWF